MFAHRICASITEPSTAMVNVMLGYPERIGTGSAGTKLTIIRFESGMRETTEPSPISGGKSDAWRSQSRPAAIAFSSEGKSPSGTCADEK